MRTEPLGSTRPAATSEPRQPDAPARHTTVDISVKGRWATLPALQVGGTNIIVRGRWLRIASIHDEPWIEREIDDPERCVQALRRLGVGGRRADIFTFAQRLPATTPNYRYPLEWENLAVARLPTYASWWEKLPRESRWNVRRAARCGVALTVRDLDDDLIGGIVELNNDDRIRQGVPFYHYGKTFEEVRRDQSVYLERSEFICAHLHGELIGFLKLVYCDRFGVVIQALTKHNRRAERPANALIARAVERCVDRGLPYLVHGKYRYGNQPDTSLMEFKRRNGFEPVLVPRFYVPLTRKGALGMALRLHRDRVSTLPRPAIAVGRSVRAAWHALRTRDERG